MSTPQRLRIAYVPEHYSLPLHLSLPYFTGIHASPSIPLTLHPFPSGTGAMISALRAGEIDIAIGLTEGWVAGLGTTEGKELCEQGKGGYKVVGSWVQTPLRWSIVTGRGRDDLVDVGGLKGGRVGVSRMGSGSHIMSFVLAQEQSFPQFEPVILGPFGPLREGVCPSPDHPKARADFFMWEHFTTKPYFDPPTAQLKWIGEIHTPWPSWLIVASDTTFPDPANDERLKSVLEAFDRGVAAFEADTGAAVRAMADAKFGIHYEEGDAREWLKDVRFENKTRGVSGEVVGKVVDILRTAGVIKQESGSMEEIVDRIVGIKR